MRSRVLYLARALRYGVLSDWMLRLNLELLNYKIVSDAILMCVLSKMLMH